MTVKGPLECNPVDSPYDFHPTSPLPGFTDPLPPLEESASVHTILPDQNLQEVVITWPVHPHTIAIRLFGAQNALHQKIKSLLQEQETVNSFLTSHYGFEVSSSRALILINGCTGPQLWDMLALIKTPSHDPSPAIQLLASAHITIPSLYKWQAENRGRLGDAVFYTRFLNWPWLGRLPQEMAEYFTHLATSAHKTNSVWSRRTFSHHRLHG